MWGSLHNVHICWHLKLKGSSRRWGEHVRPLPLCGQKRGNYYFSGQQDHCIRLVVGDSSISSAAGTVGACGTRKLPLW